MRGAIHPLPQNAFMMRCSVKESTGTTLPYLTLLYPTLPYLFYGLDDPGFESRQGLGIFLFATASRPALGPTQPPIKWVTGSLSLREKRPGREADHSPPSTADVKNAWSCISAPQYVLIAWFLVKAQEQVCLYIYLIHFTLFSTSFVVSFMLELL
jgi:hypothetical protein